MSERAGDEAASTRQETNDEPRHSGLSLGVGAAVYAFDVGGTDTKAVVMDEHGDILEVIRVRTPRADIDPAEAVLANVVTLAGQFAVDHPEIVPQAVGLLVPGYVDDVAGVGIYSENLGWRDAPFRERAQQLLGLPVFFGHDVRVAGEAEHRIGAAAPFRDVVIMAIGTGIAGAIFINGEIYAGGGMSGEMGHSAVADGPDCVCGSRGCLEAVASAGAIARRYTAATGETVDGAREVLQRSRAGDEIASAIWESALDVLVLDLSHTVALLAPEAIVIGGGLAQAGDALFEPLRSRLDAMLTFQRRPLLLPASIGENAGVIGAAMRARELLDAPAMGGASGVSA